MRCLIIDGEKPARIQIRQLLSTHLDVEVTGEAKNVEDALELFQREKPDLIFLDVQLQGGTGFDFLECLRRPLPHIVFITAHDRYAIRAFEYQALDYLLKPVKPERLAGTLQRVRTASQAPTTTRPESYTSVKMSRGTRFVPWSEILSIKSEGNYTQLFLVDGTTPLILRTLKEWEKIAPPGHFLQVHRSVLVCSQAIRELRSTADGQHELLLTNGKEIPVGRTFWPKLKEAVKRFSLS